MCNRGKSVNHFFQLPIPLELLAQVHYNVRMANTSQQLVSIIVPCFNEEGMVDAFLERVRAVCEGLPEYGFEFLFVDDGSRDGTNAAIVARAERDPRVKLVTLSRNFGHQRAIAAGLDLCLGDYVVVIDADLQDPPELIPQILERLRAGSDIVHMVRESRDVDSFAKRFSARVFYAFMRRYVLPALPEDAPDFKGFNRRVLDTLRLYGERVRFLRGIIATLGFRQAAIPYVREARYAGKSKYPWKNVLRFGRDAVVSYSVIPLRVGLVAGIAVCAATAVFAAVCVAACIAGALPQPTVMFLIALVGGLGGLLLVMLGIVGEYLGCMMRELKQRPLYIVESLVNLAPPGKDAES